MDTLLIIFFFVITSYLMIDNHCNNLDVKNFYFENDGPVLFVIGGSHGNEQGSVYGINAFIKDLIKNKSMFNYFSKIIVLPNANKSGLLFETREMVHRLTHRDLNRNYPSKHGQHARDSISRKICKLVDKADWVLDFHEGWGFVKERKGSMGSGIFPNTCLEAETMAREIEKSINETIDNPLKKFEVQINHISPEGTLQDYATLKNKKYILFETTGQNDIQPISLRKVQVLHILNYFINNLHRSEENKTN
jgi:predicted deacylase